MQMENFMERRKHKRFKVRAGAFAVIQPNLIRQGQIIDISKGGLSFHYYALDKSEPVNKPHELNILSDEMLILEKVPYASISEFKIDNERLVAPLTKWKCCVQFGKIHLSLRAQLANFIQSHTAQDYNPPDELGKINGINYENPAISDFNSPMI
jgi:hypothetical protein